MTDAFWQAFWHVHHDLPRGGPGLADDVIWAVEKAGAGGATRVLDAGSGPGGDIAALLDAMPDAHVTAVDTHADFVEAICDSFPSTRVDARQSDMKDVVGPFDFIWSAGAVYFLGIETALTAWRAALAEDGSVAFSHPAFFTETPSEAARAFWAGEGVTIGTADEIAAEVAGAGFDVIASRPVSDAAWEAYYGPLEARIERLSEGACSNLEAAIAETRKEIDGWRRVKQETGYLLLVVRPR